MQCPNLLEHVLLIFIPVLSRSVWSTVGSVQLFILLEFWVSWGLELSWWDSALPLLLKPGFHFLTARVWQLKLPRSSKMYKITWSSGLLVYFKSFVSPFITDFWNWLPSSFFIHSLIWLDFVWFLSYKRIICSW